MRGQFSGISDRHQVSHLIRATMEGVVFSLRHAAEAADRAGHQRNTQHLIGGGANSDLWAQIVADVFGLGTERILGSAPAHGSALLGGIGVGLLSWSDMRDLGLRPVDRFLPDPGRKSIYAEAYEVFRARSDEIDQQSRRPA